MTVRGGFFATVSFLAVFGRVVFTRWEVRTSPFERPCRPRQEVQTPMECIVVGGLR